MRLQTSILVRARQSRKALTLIEIMVASALLVVIAGGLLVAFDTTQKAFRTGLKQTDVMEGGRFAMEIIARDIKQANASGFGGNINMAVTESLTNSVLDISGGTSNGLVRANVFQRLFFLSRLNDWNGLGYRVLNSADPNLPVGGMVAGSLYRFSTNSSQLGNNNLFTLFTAGNPGNMVTNNVLSRVLDGVVDLRFRFFDSLGQPFLNNTNLYADQTNVNLTVLAQNVPEIQSAYFYDRAVPSFVEVELAVLEPPVAEEMRLLQTDAAKAAFLKRKSAYVHLFRQQVPIISARQ